MTRHPKARTSRGAPAPAPDDTPFPARRHDHRGCVATAIDQALNLCARRGVRLTPLRRRVLELLWRNHAPAGAYDILKSLAREHPGATPATVYRALDFLLAQGLVHRLESANAFVGCARPGDAHASQFLMCSDCGAVAELHDPAIGRAIARGAGKVGFVAEETVVEVRSRCPACLERR